MFFDKPSPPYLVAISGVSATGKTTLISQLNSYFGGGRVVTFTTRPKRENEADDAYHFCSINKLQEISDTLWTRIHYGHVYAVTKSSVMQTLNQFGIAFLPTVSSNHTILRTALPEFQHLGIHLLAPHRAELERRMTLRGAESTDINKRLEAIERIDQKASNNILIHLIAPSTQEETWRRTLEIILSFAR